MKKVFFILAFSLIGIVSFGQSKPPVTNEVTMNGSYVAGDLPILKIEWSQVSGPATPKIEDLSNLKTKVTMFSIPGVYTFRLTVWDTGANAHSDDMTVTVLPPNIPPVSRAGAAIQIQLPTVKK